MLYIKKYLGNQTIYGQFYFPFHAEPLLQPQDKTTRKGGKIMNNHTEVKLTLYSNCKTFVLLVSVTLKIRFVTWIVAQSKFLV